MQSPYWYILVGIGCYITGMCSALLVNMIYPIDVYGFSLGFALGFLVMELGKDYFKGKVWHKD